MTIDQFVSVAEFDKLLEVDKGCFLAFFHLKESGIQEFTAADCADWLHGLQLARPNVSRLADRLRSSQSTVRGKASNSYRLHLSFIREMEQRFPQLLETSQDVVDLGTILPEILFGKTRGFIESLAKQINASYEGNIFDGCAVLMRRLEEVLLIMSYERLGIAEEIKDTRGNYFLLEGIVSNAQSNKILGLSRNSKVTIETIRELGNYSAHKITYTCKREYLKENINEFRALVDELLHKSGVRT